VVARASGFFRPRPLLNTPLTGPGPGALPTIWKRSRVLEALPTMADPLRSPARPPAPPVVPRGWRLLRRAGMAALVAAASLAGAGCSGDDNPLAPYEGDRALDLLKVTQRFQPELQWVGGRVAAIGVNRGPRAALDETLVYLRLADDNSIGSVATYGEAMADALVASFGGTPQERLTSGETYTFWLAERAAFDAGLDSLQIDPATFVDTTMTMRVLFVGQSGGSQVDATFVVERDERVTGDQFIVRWEPADLRFRQMAIREATVGGFNRLIWWIDTPPDVSDEQITSPVTFGFGVPPAAGLRQVQPFREAGFAPDLLYNPDPPETPPAERVDVRASTYFLWATTDDWNETFSANAPGYAWIRLDICNFDIDDLYPDPGFFCD
jgi:hypothetical protein